MNLQEFLIPAEEGFRDWANKQAQKNMGRGISNQRALQKAINANSNDPLRTMTPVKVINAVYRSLNARGEKFVRDKKQNTYLVRDCVVTPGLKIGGHYTVQGAAFVIMGKTNVLHQNNLDIREIRYFTESGEKSLNRNQITELVSADKKPSLDSLLIPTTESFTLPDGANVAGLIQYLIKAGKIVISTQAANKLYMSLKNTDLSTYTGILESGQTTPLNGSGLKKNPIVALARFTGHTTVAVLKYVTKGKDDSLKITSLGQKDFESYLNSLK